MPFFFILVTGSCFQSMGFMAQLVDERIYVKYETSEALYSEWVIALASFCVDVPIALVGASAQILIAYQFSGFPGELCDVGDPPFRPDARKLRESFKRDLMRLVMLARTLPNSCSPTRRSQRARELPKSCLEAGPKLLRFTNSGRIAPSLGILGPHLAQI